MKKSILFMTIAFLLEINFSVFIPYHSLFQPLFVFVTLLLLADRFPHQDRSYFLLAFVTGLIYDLFTHTLFLNAILFIILAFLYKKIQTWVPSNWITIFLMDVVWILLYRILSYVLLVIIAYLPFSITALKNSIISSFFLNILYIYIIKLGTLVLHKNHHFLRPKRSKC